MIDALPGFREFYPEDCYIRNFIFEKVRQMCRCFGFVEYDSPILEPLELYTEKSGEEIAKQLFNFVDRGGRAVALRPEMTPAVARMIGSKTSTLKRPLKWFCVEENFRYERPQKGRLRSFYQFNADIFDESSVAAEAEVIALAVAIFQSLGLSAADFHVRLSDRQLWSILLQTCDIRENLAAEILCIVDKIERENPAEIVNQFNNLGVDGASLLAKIQALRTIHSRDDLKNFFNPLAAEKSSFRGEITQRLEQMDALVTPLENAGLGDFITIDFSIVRGLAYYTGFVFEFFERSGKSRAMAGGGRYDDLIEKFGYPKTAAVGLAIGDVVLTNILQEKSLLPAFEPKCDLYMIFDEASRPSALHDAHRLRLAGISVTYALKAGMTPNKQFKQALQQADWVATYQEKNETVTLRDIARRKDYAIPHAELVHFFQQQK
ncbi:MAG: histidine--tRNA ligase [Puniceicoccales bacterium]|jgi:histidyl-tRNA synthetase|nr:histidine--tRNA ligase [Puniceicoccales bacterium]